MGDSLEKRYEQKQQQQQQQEVEAAKFKPVRAVLILRGSDETRVASADSSHIASALYSRSCDLEKGAYDFSGTDADEITKA